jgi:hypothetical protein
MQKFIMKKITKPKITKNLRTKEKKFYAQKTFFNLNAKFSPHKSSQQQRQR